MTDKACSYKLGAFCGWWVALVNLVDNEGGADWRHAYCGKCVIGVCLRMKGSPGVAAFGFVS